MIVHGGVNTVNEVLMFGVPILGVPLQGDQPSNLNRLVELGMGQLADIKVMRRPGGLLSAMAKMEANYCRYKQRAGKVAAMIRHHRRLIEDSEGRMGRNLQGFWLEWAMRHGRRLRREGSKILMDSRKGFRGFIDYFCLPEIASAIAVLSLLIAFTSV